MSETPTHPAPPILVLIDCDPGHDDAIAILMAAALPQLRLVGITTVAGNQTLEKTTRNARVVCGVAGITDVPIAAGADRPLVRDPITAAEVHGESGLDGPRLDGLEAPLDPRHAIDLIVETYEAATEPITLVAIGPLTNVALALRLYPFLADRIPLISLMGGAWGLGNVTPGAEFNIHADPDAARVVIESGIPIRMSGLELTRHAAIHDDVIERVARLDTAVGRFVGDILHFYRASHEARHGNADAPIFDACAVAWLARPELVDSRLMHVEVITTAGPDLGRTVTDVEGVLRRAPNVEVGIDLDREGFWDLVFTALETYG
jgi:inosine-uridine nucleoside N-ribohydrolase